MHYMQVSKMSAAEKNPYQSPAQEIMNSHPLQGIKLLVNEIIEGVRTEFDAFCTERSGDFLIPPRSLLFSTIIQALYSIHSADMLMLRIDKNHLYRIFVELELNEKIWDYEIFTKNRDIFLSEPIGRALFCKVIGVIRWYGLVYSDHFIVDENIIESWAVLGVTLGALQSDVSHQIAPRLYRI